VKLITHSPPLPHTSSWHGAYLSTVTALPC